MSEVQTSALGRAQRPAPAVPRLAVLAARIGQRLLPWLLPLALAMAWQAASAISALPVTACQKPRKEPWRKTNSAAVRARSGE